MRLFTTIVLILIFSISATAQELYTKIAEETCHCLEKKSPEGLNQSQKEMTLGVCMMEGLKKYKAEFDSFYEGKSFATIDMEKFGENIGIEMVAICPYTFFDFVEDEFDYADTAALSIEFGKITSIEKNQFNIINLETGDGSVLKFLWLWEFEGSEVLTDKTYKDQWLNIIYSNVSLYDAQKETYVNFRVIEAIDPGE